MIRWLSRRRGAQNPDLVPRWRAFVTSPAADGEPVIRPANVPPVKPLVGIRMDEGVAYRFGVWVKFPQRRA